ncbi:CHRD domain-containing protein [Hymenobacter psoromatis]|uniref:CHRD domain-containing protein n=1 Tax=Hymenobacter psoromatis TaxID=1484116 RepID=UPI001CBC2C5D|nr:CHRD domain-containing protein [Hymenobacter psoromatis]
MYKALLIALASLTLATTACKKKDDTPAPAPPPMQLSGSLSSANSVTINASDPAVQSNGSGNVTGTYDKTSMVLTYTVTYQDLSGPATAGHFHIGAPGTNGPVTISFPSLTSPITGTATLNQAQADALMAGNLYANLHTAKYPNSGEIRAVVVAK